MGTDLLQDPAYRRLHDILSSLESAAIAYSGGVDSTFLLKVAQDAMGDRVHGVLAFSESLDRNEFEEAKALAERIEAPLTIVETREYSNPDYRKNAPDRCYHCKTELFSTVQAWASEHEVRWVLDGSHAGDIGDYRPGLRARDEQKVRSPLMEAGLDKEDIRRFSRQLGLPTWDKPAAPCLSSRIPYGSEVTDEKLRAIEAAEKSLRDVGFRVVRVRHHGDVARIEVPREDLPRLLSGDVHAKVSEGVKAAGFRFVAVDLEGFRSGSLNSVLEPGAELVQVEPFVHGSVSESASSKPSSSENELREDDSRAGGQRARQGDASAVSLRSCEKVDDPPGPIESGGVLGRAPE